MIKPKTDISVKMWALALPYQKLRVVRGMVGRGRVCPCFLARLTTSALHNVHTILRETFGFRLLPILPHFIHIQSDARATNCARRRVIRLFPVPPPPQKKVFVLPVSPSFVDVLHQATVQH